MLERLRQCVAKYGWQCLTSEWMGVNSRHQFACARGHVFERVALTLLYRNSGAPVCIFCQQEDIRDRWLGKLAERGGTLLSGPFVGLFARYQIRCAAGHEWSVEGRKISEGRWCPICAHGDATRRSCCSDGLARLHAKAQERDGKCLSSNYTIESRLYRFECAKGHRWEARANDIFRGTWCGRCAKLTTSGQVDPNGLARLQAAAREKGGVCLTDAYVGSAAKYPFRCAMGHEWVAIASQIWLGHWCRQCAGQKLRQTIDDMRALATARGGLCLSKEYQGRRTKLTWQCHRGHIWESRPINISAGTWCPQCAITNRTRRRDN